VRINSVVEWILGRGWREDSRKKVDLKFTFIGYGRLDSILGSYSIPGINFSSHYTGLKYRLSKGVREWLEESVV
jgi:hypothetical protein